MARLLPVAYYQHGKVLRVPETNTGTHVTVEVEQGTLRGQEKISTFVPFKKYYSFASIPYAKPPVGPLRFKDPEEPEPWSGVRDAVTQELNPDPPVCWYLRPSSYELYYRQKPTEDCLYLDVDTPQINEHGKPVIVWLHPVFFIDEPSDFGGQYFCVGDYMAEDVVLVTVGYRHNVLGFLRLDHEEVPGNAGLKDQVMALKWVQKNIAKFGGDPNNVTLCGKDIAGLFVHYHLISRLSEGLFHRVMIQGDCVLNPHAYVSSDIAIKSAFRLGKLLGKDTKNTDELLEFLRSVPVADLLRCATSQTYIPGENQFYHGTAFAPCIEVPAFYKSFLPLTPKELLKQGRFIKVPTMMGVTNHIAQVSWRVRIDNEEVLKTEKAESIREMAKVVGYPVNTEEPGEWLKEIENFYFSNIPSAHAFTERCGELVSDFSFHIGFDEALRMHLEHTEKPVYAFEFLPSALDCYVRPYIDGEDKHLYEPNTPYHALIKIWTSFAKTGHPNTEAVSAMWEPARRDNFCYLQIGVCLKLIKGRVAEDRIKMWQQLLEKYPDIREKYHTICTLKLTSNFNDVHSLDELFCEKE